MYSCCFSGGSDSKSSSSREAKCVMKEALSCDDCSAVLLDLANINADHRTSSIKKKIPAAMLRFFFVMRPPKHDIRSPHASVIHFSEYY